MATNVPLTRRLATAATWPAGVAITSWQYIWRITPIHRRDQEGEVPEDLPPELPPGVSREQIQGPAHGVGPLFHRLYHGTVTHTDWTPERLMADIQANPNRVVPRSLARFQKTHGEHGDMQPGDEYVVRMPGPWDGPIRVLEVTPTSFRVATLESHLEAGQIEWRAYGRPDRLQFEVESWARTGDRLSALLHDRLRMAKEVQLHMWSSVVEQVARRAGGRLQGGLWISTRRVGGEAFDENGSNAAKRG